MNKNTQKQGGSNSPATGMVTREEALDIARELAVLNGHSAPDTSKSDQTKDRWELTSQTDVDSKTAILESAPESERWDPLPGSTGHKTSVTASVDEDDGGRSANEQLVEEGVLKAERDHLLEARKAAVKNT